MTDCDSGLAGPRPKRGETRNERKGEDEEGMVVRIMVVGSHLAIILSISSEHTLARTHARITEYTKLIKIY